MLCHHKIKLPLNMPNMPAYSLDQAMSQDPIFYEVSINKHAAWVFRHIYSHPYSKTESKSTEGIARYYHGMQHICRTAIFVPIFANLYRKYQNQEALLLTEDDVKLLQITALFHDAARKDEGEDLWDDESATMLYFYLKGLGVKQNKARLLAEAVANKDTHAEGYHQLSINAKQAVWTIVKQKPKNIYQKIIHDVDCLDIIRVRDHFKADYLDFYCEIASRITSAFEELSQLITEARSVINIQGDSPQQRQPEIKSLYEIEDGFLKIAATFNNKHFHILPHLYQANKLLSASELQKPFLPTFIFDPKKGWCEENVKAAMYEGKLFARGIALPSAINNKALTHLDGNQSVETMANVENRKLMRRKGIATTSSKDNRTDKQGNPNRSVSMLAYGAGIFTNAGYLFYPDIDAVTCVSKTNINSGFQKKTNFTPPMLTHQEKNKKLIKLLHHLKMGGSSTSYDGFPATHNEITYNIEAVGAIYYSNDPTPLNMNHLIEAAPFHTYSPILQAIFLQKQYKNTHGLTLPLFEYSGLHNRIRKVNEEEYTNQKVLAMWVKMCSDYIRPQLSKLSKLTTFAVESLPEIKVKAMYGMKLSSITSITTGFYPGDSNYSNQLETTISKAIKNEKKKLLLETSVLTQYIFFAAAGDIKKFKKLALSGGKFNRNWNDNPYMLIMKAAIVNGQTKLLKFIITEVTGSQKYLLAKSSLTGDTPLHTAATYNRLDVVTILLAAGARVNVVNNDGESPLHIAIKNKHVAIVNALLTSWITINDADKKGETPLVLAIESSQIEIIDLLLSHEVDINMAHRVTSGDLFEMINKLAGRDDNNKLKSVVITPLHRSIFYGHLNIVRKLIAIGAMVTDISEGISCYDLACAMKYEKLAAVLMLYEPKMLKATLERFDLSFLLQISAEDEIEKVAENIEAMNAILQSNDYQYVDHIIQEYFKKTGRPVHAYDNKINFLHYNDSPTFRLSLQTGKISGYKMDEFGRYIAKAFHLTDGSFKKKIKIFVGKDFTKFNFDACTIKAFTLAHTLWCFRATDHVTFHACKMNNFKVTPDSDLQNVELIDPVFSNSESVEMIASFYKNIPAFLLKHKYLDVLKKSFEQGKKIDLSNFYVRKRIEEILDKNEFNLIEFLLKHGAAVNDEQLVKSSLLAYNNCPTANSSQHTLFFPAKQGIKNDESFSNKVKQSK